jgi:uncharacterized protein (TIGR02246 family)
VAAVTRIKKISSVFHARFIELPEYAQRGQTGSAPQPTGNRAGAHELTYPLNIQDISGLNRSCCRFCLAALLLFVFHKGAIQTAQAGESDDVKALLQLESQMAQAWVARDTQILGEILAEDYTLAGTGEHLIGKAEYIAGLNNPEFETTSAIVDNLGIRVYGDAAVVTGRATYQGSSKKRGAYVHRFRFTDTFIRHDRTWQCVATHASALAPD